MLLKEVSASFFNIFVAGTAPPWSFEIHWVRYYQVNLMGLAGIVNATLQDQAKFRRYLAWQIAPNFKICFYH